MRLLSFIFEPNSIISPHRDSDFKTDFPFSPSETAYIKAFQARQVKGFRKVLQAWIGTLPGYSGFLIAYSPKGLGREVKYPLFLRR